MSDYAEMKKWALMLHAPNMEETLRRIVMLLSAERPTDGEIAQAFRLAHREVSRLDGISEQASEEKS